jgi:hypothetical protein
VYSLNIEQEFLQERRKTEILSQTVSNLEGEVKGLRSQLAELTEILREQHVEQSKSSYVDRLKQFVDNQHYMFVTDQHPVINKVSELKGKTVDFVQDSRAELSSKWTEKSVQTRHKLNDVKETAKMHVQGAGIALDHLTGPLRDEVKKGASKSWNAMKSLGQLAKTVAISTTKFIGDLVDDYNARLQANLSDSVSKDQEINKDNKLSKFLSEAGEKRKEFIASKKAELGSAQKERDRSMHL